VTSRVELDAVTGTHKPTGCAVSRWHKPKVYRFVLHHVMPQVCGGRTTAENLVGLDDSCHYTIHLILRELSLNGGDLTKITIGNRAQRKLAQQGYDACVLAGTVHKIPNEG